MINQELRTYIATQLARGVTRPSIEKVLRDTGWKEIDIQEAFAAAISPVSPTINTSSYTPTGAVNVMPGIVDVASKKSSSKGLVFTSIFLTVFLMAGGFAYVQYFQTPAPQTVLTNMMSAVGNVTTFEYRVRADTEGTTCIDAKYSFSDGGEMTTTCNDKKPFSNTTTISGVADITSRNNPTHQLTLTAENTLPNEDGLSEKAMVQVDLISLEKALYLKISNLVFPMASFFDTTTFINKWISVDIAELQQQYLGTDPSSNTELVSNEKRERIKQVFLDANILSVADVTNDVIEGVSVYKYAFEINQEKQKELFIGLYSILYEGVTKEDIETIAENMNGLGVIEAELWVGKKDFLPYRIVIMPDVVVYDGMFEVESANVSFDFKNYNAPVVIQAPSPTVTFDEVMAKLFAPVPEVATTSVKVAPKR